MSKEITIYNVAEKAGVSITTVSRVLNKPLLVSETTRTRVLAVIRELGFVPKAEAVARARQDFRRIGVMLPFFTSPSFIQRIRGVLQTLNHHEYEVITYAVENYEQLKNYLSVIPLTRKVDGLIVMALPLTEVDIGYFKQAGIPVVSIEFANADISHVVIDNKAGGKLAAEYLLSKGRNTLGFIGEGGEPPYSLHATDERLSGFLETVRRQGFDVPDNYVVRHPYGMAEAIASAISLLRLPQRPTGIFAAADMYAVATVKAAQQLNISIPGDLAVLGFDNIDLADYMNISTICQSLDESGRMAALMLLEHLSNTSSMPRKVTFPLKLIERGTS